MRPLILMYKKKIRNYIINCLYIRKNTVIIAVIIIVKEQTNFRYLQIKGEYYASNSRKRKKNTAENPAG